MRARPSGALFLVASSWVAAPRAGGRSLHLRFAHGREREGVVELARVRVQQLLPPPGRSAGRFPRRRPYETRETLSPPTGDDRDPQFSMQRGSKDQRASGTRLHRRNVQPFSCYHASTRARVRRNFGFRAFAVTPAGGEAAPTAAVRGTATETPDSRLTPPACRPGAGRLGRPRWAVASGGDLDADRGGVARLVVRGAVSPFDRGLEASRDKMSERQAGNGLNALRIERAQTQCLIRPRQTARAGSDRRNHSANAPGFSLMMGR